MRWEALLCTDAPARSPLLATSVAGGARVPASQPLHWGPLLFFFLGLLVVLWGTLTAASPKVQHLVGPRLPSLPLWRSAPSLPVQPTLASPSGRHRRSIDWMSRSGSPCRWMGDVTLSFLRVPFFMCLILLDLPLRCLMHTKFNSKRSTWLVQWTQRVGEASISSFLILGYLNQK